MNFFFTVDDSDISKDGSFSSPLSFKPKISKRSSLSVENVYDNSITFGANEIKKLLSETSSVGLTQNQNTAKAGKQVKRLCMCNNLNLLLLLFFVFFI